MRPTPHTMSLKLHALLLDRVLLPRWQRWWVYATTGLLVASGLLWLALDVARADQSPSRFQVWSLRIHGVSAAAAAIAYGSLITAHIRIGWALDRNRILGAVNGAIVVALVATGSALYYAPSEEIRAVASIVHWVIGIAMPVALVVHIYRGRLVRRRGQALPRC